MTVTAKSKNGMWAYLESIGVLEKGTEADITKSKKEYKRLYIKEYKRKERASNAEFFVLLSKHKGELKTISEAAKEHNTSISNFIKTSALSYLRKTYLVPDKEKVASLEIILSDCRNEIKKISKNTILPIADKIQGIEKRIEIMESSINDLFRNPPELP